MKYTDEMFGTFDERVKYCATVELNRCRDCGNPWWHDLPQSWVCTTCGKTYGKSSEQELAWKPAHPLVEKYAQQATESKE